MLSSGPIVLLLIFAIPAKYADVVLAALVSTVLAPMILSILMILMGGALTLFERKVLSTYQCRVGPDVVGERGRLQFLVDALKVLFKEVIFLNKTSSRAVVLLPVGFLIINVYYTFTLEDRLTVSFIGTEFTPLVLLALLAASNYLIVLVGQTLKNRYTRLASVRAASMGVSVDILFAFVIGVIALINGTLCYVAAPNASIGRSVTLLLPVAPIILTTVLADIGKPPFDLVESESELIMGVHSDLSGFLFVVWLLGEYLHIFILSWFLTLLYL